MAPSKCRLEPVQPMCDAYMTKYISSKTHISSAQKVGCQHSVQKPYAVLGGSGHFPADQPLHAGGFARIAFPHLAASRRRSLWLFGCCVVSATVPGSSSAIRPLHAGGSTRLPVLARHSFPNALPVGFASVRPASRAPRPSPSSWLRRVRGSRPSRKPSSSHAAGRTPGARVAPGRRWFPWR